MSLSRERQNYNEFVQMVQREAMAFGLEWRIHAPRYMPRIPNHAFEKDIGKVVRSELQVYWDGKWVCLAVEKPFALTDSERDMATSPDQWERIKFQAAEAIATS